MPETLTVLAETGDNSQADCFLWEEREGQVLLTGLTEMGRQASRLVLPTAIQGMPVTALADGIFVGNTNLQEVVLQWQDPNTCRPGSNLLEGANTGLRLTVPRGCVGTYKLNYFWSTYSKQIEEQSQEQTEERITERITEQE